MNSLLILAWWGIGLCPPDLAPDLSLHSMEKEYKELQRVGTEEWYWEQYHNGNYQNDNSQQNESSSKDQGGHE